MGCVEAVTACKTMEDITGPDGLIQKIIKDAVQHVLQQEINEYIISEKKKGNTVARKASSRLWTLGKIDKAICRAMESCETSGITVPDHFREVTKMITIGKGGQRPVKDYMLTRHACYLIAQNGDPKKEEIAFAQSYFASAANVGKYVCMGRI